MPRVKRGRAHIKRRKNVLKKTKGYNWGRKNKIKQAREAILHAGQHALYDRHAKKRVARALWQVKINAAVREHNFNYSRFIALLKKNKVELDRKVLSQLAMTKPEAIANLIINLK
ncbi:MAG: 50S ribosomal protein L20 [Patescibacteria group bacterium]